MHCTADIVPLPPRGCPFTPYACPRAGHVSCAEILLRAGARPSSRCDGNPPLCMATCLALLGGGERAAAASQLVGLLLAAGVDPSEK